MDALIYKDETAVIQYPFVLAYAITIHKSQGMTYQRIACNLSACFAPRQAYVALSRGTNFDELYLTEKIGSNPFFVDSAIVNFYNSQIRQKRRWSHQNNHCTKTLRSG